MENPKTTKNLILNKAYVLALRFMVYGREEDAELPQQVVLDAIKDNIITEQDIANALMLGIKLSLKTYLVKKYEDKYEKLIKEEDNGDNN